MRLQGFCFSVQGEGIPIHQIVQMPGSAKNNKRNRKNPDGTLRNPAKSGLCLFIPSRLCCLKF